jgi:hypothetical protein
VNPESGRRKVEWVRRKVNEPRRIVDANRHDVEEFIRKIDHPWPVLPFIGERERPRYFTKPITTKEIIVIDWVRALGMMIEECHGVRALKNNNMHAVTAFGQLFHISHRGLRPSKLFSFAQRFALRTRCRHGLFAECSVTASGRLFRVSARPLVSAVSQQYLTSISAASQQCISAVSH